MTTKTALNRSRFGYAFAAVLVGIVLASIMLTVESASHAIAVHDELLLGRAISDIRFVIPSLAIAMLIDTVRYWYVALPLIAGYAALVRFLPRRSWRGEALAWAIVAVVLAVGIAMLSRVPIFPPGNA
jgi:hypothetical protein